MKVDNKKLIMPMVVAVTTLLLMVIGATYAYISVNATGNLSTFNITGSVPSVGSVAITAGSPLSMSLSLSQLQIGNAKTYYASEHGVVTDPTTSNVATITATGNGTFDCTYTINIKGDPHTMADNSVNKGTNLFVLIVYHYNSTNGHDIINTYDFNTLRTANGEINSSTGVNISGKVTGVKEGTPKYIKAQLKFVNSSSADQSSIAGTSAKFTFDVTAFSCTAY